MKKQTIVFILSSNYSGSHHLSLMLGSHSRSAHVGETKHLRKNSHINCWICRDKPDCTLFAGINEGNIDSLFEILFSRIDTNIDVLIDTSKKPEWATKFLKQKEHLDFKFIHLIRDPRALVRRWGLVDYAFRQRSRFRGQGALRYPRHAVSTLFGPIHYAQALRWLKQNDNITDFLINNHLDYMTVTYRDLVTNTEKIISEIMEWIGLLFESSQLDYWKFEHHGTQKAEYHTLKEKNKESFDLRWQKDITQKVQNQVVGLSAIKHYLAKNEIHISDNGLTID